MYTVSAASNSYLNPYFSGSSSHTKKKKSPTKKPAKQPPEVYQRRRLGVLGSIVALVVAVPILFDKRQTIDEPQAPPFAIVFGDDNLVPDLSSPNVEPEVQNADPVIATHLLDSSPNHVSGDWKAYAYEQDLIGEGYIPWVGIDFRLDRNYALLKPFPTEADFDAFYNEVIQLSQDLNARTGTEFFTPDMMFSVLAHESANTFSPAVTNDFEGNDGCVGLIQYCTPGRELIEQGHVELREMSALEQLQGPVRTYYMRTLDIFGNPASQAAAYTLVLYPATASADIDGTVIDSSTDPRDYNANHPFDTVDGDNNGVIEKNELVNRLQRVIFDNVPKVPA